MIDTVYFEEEVLQHPTATRVKGASQSKLGSNKSLSGIIQY